MTLEAAELTEAGSQTAVEFRTFYEAERERLARALFLLTRDRHEADDLAQEALVRVYERWDRVREMDSPTGYLFRTAMNLNRSRLRRLGVAARRLVHHPSPSNPMDVVGERDEVARALESLPLGQRQVLVLIDWLGLSSEETGRILKLEPVSVRVRRSRAHAALRHHLEANDE